MSARPDAPPDPLARAAEWFALLAGSPTPDDRRDWQRWIDADPSHAAAWQRVEALNARLRQLDEQVDRGAASRALQAMQTRRPARRRGLKLLGAMGVLGATGWLTMRTEPWQNWIADAHTATGERRDLVLADGTRLWLDTDTAVQVRYDETERRVRLLRGEVLVETGHDPAGRPWLLALAEGELRPMGTRFSVRRDDGQCRLAVFSGRVDVRPTAAPSGRVLAPGELVRFTRDGLGDTAVAAPTLDAWTRGMLVADGLPLAAVCRELRRYQHAVISCADEVASLRVVGAFPLDAPERTFDALTRTLPVRVTRPLPWWIRIEPA
ncbi:hypothetical protein CDN99_21575 [Roseateles aquatilis]|uniref:Iron dicitrate transport regulator FecR n=1 Tax=Roseateles aquatilis TaxID=431061 RepID=A0A246J0G1_9BURK|nr:FecR domain-containing protein [Roseateles aquatilis]OWQ85674.1 hypothetical protein CDN99_21575 [Roseateles aquatilis]